MKQYHHSFPLKKKKAFRAVVWISLVFVIVQGGYAQSSLKEEILALPKTKTDHNRTPPEAPKTANPFTSLLPSGAKPDYARWKSFQKQRRQYQVQLAHQQTQSNVAAIANDDDHQIDESENTPGENDEQANGQFIENFGSGSDELGYVTIRGIAGIISNDYENDSGTNQEDDSSIPLATDTQLAASSTGIIYQGYIGDRPLPDGIDELSDFDFYHFTGQEGQIIFADMNTPDPYLDLDPTLALFDSEGNLIAFNDDEDYYSFDSKLVFELTYDDEYYLCVGGYGAYIPEDPFDENSPSFTGLLGSEGSYELIVSFTERISDVDFYTFDLKKGDVFAAAVRSDVYESTLTLFLPNTEAAISSTQNYFYYPWQSPLNMEGVSSLYHIAEEDGTYAIALSESYDEYLLDMMVTRPRLEIEQATQVILLDFDGAWFDLDKFYYGEPGYDQRYLSPFRNFLQNWDLPDDPQTVINLTQRITEKVKENLKDDIKVAAINPNFEVVIASNNGLGNSENSHQRLAQTQASKTQIHRELASYQSNGLTSGNLQKLVAGRNPNIPSVYYFSKVIIGGTIEESGIYTIGIAESIDPGNFAPEETALVLLDDLSAPPIGDPWSFSLNDVPLAPGVTKEDLVVTAIGNIVAHEIGHFLGSFHTDGYNSAHNLMDEGPGGLMNLIGVEPDGAFGDQNTVDVDFITDTYSYYELFFGNENTQNQTAWALSSPFVNSINQELAGKGSGTRMKLSQSYPNPASFNESLNISFEVQEKERVKILLYDLQGQPKAVLFDDTALPGKPYQLEFSLAKLHLQEGTYLYRMSTGEGAISRRVTLHP